MTTTRRSWAVAVLAAIALVGPACGSTKSALPRRALPGDLVPATIPDPTDPANPVALVEFPAARDRFAKAGPRSLVDDGRMWELRRGANLIGTVEVGAFARKVELTSEGARRKLTTAILPATSTAIKVHGVAVTRSASEDKVSYLLFGDGLFELVDIKVSDKVDPEQIIAALVDAEVPTGHLRSPGRSRRRPL